MLKVIISTISNYIYHVALGTKLYFIFMLLCTHWDFVQVITCTAKLYVYIVTVSK